jgi:transcriptional regulator with XRE-family HTH domain
MIITSEQIRAARALLRWEQKELAEASKVSLPSVKRLETIPGELAAQVRTVEALRQALEAAGVEFTNGGRPGVRIRKKFVPGDYARANQVGPTKVSAVGRDHDGEIRATIAVRVDKRK